MAGAFANAVGNFLVFESVGFDREVGESGVEWAPLFEQMVDGLTRVWGEQEWAVAVA